jgi:PAS domain S-box-containing protein
VTRPGPNRPAALSALLRDTAGRYAIALAAAVVAVGLRRLLDPVLEDRYPYALPFLAVLVTARYGGFGPALAATVVGAVAAVWFLLPPHGRFAFTTTADQFGLILYLGVGAGIAVLGGAMRVARLRAEATAAGLRESEQLLRLVIDTVPHYIFAKDRDGRFLFVNRFMAEQNGFASPDAMIGLSEADSAPDKAQAEAFLKADREVIDSGKPAHIPEEVVTDVAGRIRVVQTVKIPFTFPSPPRPAVLGVAVDITERVRAEEALKEADRRKDEFLATLAHELRNPLAPIRNALEILKLAEGNARLAAEARGTMDRQVGHMVRLIDDLLDVSRISRGKLRLQAKRIELADVIRSAVEVSRPPIEAAGLSLTVELPPGPVLLDADPTRLAQVFTNLLNNAAKFTDAGGQVSLTAEPLGGEVVVRVRDTGIGIAATDLPRVFDPFTQADRGLARVHGGLGIGLTLVKRLTEMHGGTVSAHSAGPGTGSEFVIRLPAVSPP